MMRNKKGVYDQIVVVVIMLIVVAGIMFAFWVWSILGPTTVGLISQTSGDVRNAINNTGDGNLTAAINPSLNAIDNSIVNIEWISYAVLIMLMFGFFIMCFYVRTYPFLIFIWIGGILVLTVLSFFITSSYQDLTSGSDYVATQVKGWSTSHFLMSNLPGVFVAVGLLGGIIMFVLISKNGEAEQTYI